jgi:flagellar basal-body rod protein FlgB
MKELTIFAMASTRMDWLSARGQQVASNIANANTPGYVARDVLPFEQILSATQIGIATTNPGHFGDPAAGIARAGSTVVRTRETLSGNSVNLEAELLKIGNVRSQYNITTSVVSAFNRMILSTTRG